jgi:hypothetical protein
LACAKSVFDDGGARGFFKMSSTSAGFSVLPAITRRQLAATAGGVVLVAAWRFAICPVDVAEALVRYGGYYIEAATFGLFAWFAVREMRRAWRGWAGLRPHRWSLAVILACAIFLQVHEPHTFKVLDDEYELAAVAQNLHFQREAAMPEKMHALDGTPTLVGGIVDKRPIAYSFLVATAHDLTGYRPANSWVVNGVLAAALLVFIYATGVRWGGLRTGLTGVLLLTGLPLLAQNATGGGFDLLNMTMLAAVFLAAVHYLKEPEGRGLELLVFAAVLLAGVRYESMLYLLALPALVGLRGLREGWGSVRLSWWVAGAPVLLTLPLAVHEVYFGSDRYFQTSRVDFLNLKHVPDNLTDAVYFLFQWGSDLPNSVLLSVVGGLALVAALVFFASRWQDWRQERAPDLVLRVFLPLVLVNTAVTMGLSWGDWGDANITRYALPFLLALVWCVQWLLGRMAATRTVPGWVVAVAALYIVVVSAPTMAEAQATKSLYPHRLHDWVLAWLAEHGGNDTLVLGRSALPYIVYQQPAMTLSEANQVPERMQKLLELGLYRQILIVEEVVLDPATGQFKTVIQGGLGPGTVFNETPNPAWKTEVVAEARLHPRLIARILRITGYDKDWQKHPPAAEAAVTPPMPDKKALNEYLRAQFP